MKLGFIGLGVMGRPMARNLMQHGHEMAVYTRRPESAAPLVDAGARRYDTPAALAAACEVVFSMVTTSSVVLMRCLVPSWKLITVSTSIRG